MFKKPFQTKTRSSLRVTGCRQLAQEARELFPSAWAPIGDESDTTLEAPMPDKLQSAKFTSYVGDRGEIIYSEAGSPLWVRTEIRGGGDATLVPTVYTQWRFPGVLPVVWTGVA
ncbi:hypothetical protein LPJ61_003809, partial [Coemansia biformis]